MKKNKTPNLILLVIIILGLLLVFYFAVFKNQSAKSEQTAENNSQTSNIIGVLQFTSHPALDEIYRGIQDGLKENGYTDGKNAKIIFQNGQGDQSKLNTMSQQLIQKKSDVLIGIATPAAQALANATQKTPIILGAITDPKTAKLVEDNEKPGGNITGVSDRSPVDAQFELLSEILPDAKKVGILIYNGEDNSKFQAEEAKVEAKKHGLEAEIKSVPSSNEIAQMVQTLSANNDVIYIPTDNTIANAMQTVVSEANKSNTPVFPSVDTMVEQGGLATVSINQYEIGIQTGKMAADVLSGKSKPATTPIYTFKTGDIIINKQQAEKLGIHIPDQILEDAKIVGD